MHRIFITFMSSLSSFSTIAEHCYVVGQSHNGFEDRDGPQTDERCHWLDLHVLENGSANFINLAATLPNSPLSFHTPPSIPLHTLPNLHFPRLNPYRLRNLEIRFIIRLFDLHLRSRQYFDTIHQFTCTHIHKPFDAHIPVLNEADFARFLGVLLCSN
jgi:hypothetical protein